MSIVQVSIPSGGSGCMSVTQTVWDVEFTGLYPWIPQISAKYWVFWLDTWTRRETWACTSQMFIQPSGASDGGYLNVLLRWGIICDWGKCICQVHYSGRLPSDSIWWWRVIEEWCDLHGAMASCLSACQGHSVVYCWGQLADWSHWGGSPYCGSLLDQLFCGWLMVQCIDVGLCIVHPDFLVRPVILWILSCSWVLCSRGPFDSCASVV